MSAAGGAAPSHAEHDNGAYPVTLTVSDATAISRLTRCSSPCPGAILAEWARDVFGDAVAGSPLGSFSEAKDRKANEVVTVV